jgi:2'-5' RNA ligase
MKPELFGDIAPPHISMCYFSYPDKYPRERIKLLVPKIIAVLKKYLPLKVKVKGLMGAWEIDLGVPGILWNIQDFSKINQFHNELIDVLKEDIEHFNDPEMDFSPHIGLALGNPEKIEELKKIIKESKQNKEIELTIDRIQIFYPEGPEEIFKTS